MEKLIELFKDYVENYWNDTKDPTIDIGVIYDWQWFYVGARFYSDEKVLSKKFWFIKWLVDNDKIDFEKPIWEFANKYKLIVPDDFYLKELSKEDELLMLLSIQDNPIEFLISILKDKKVRTVYVDEDWNVSWDTKRYSDC